jgi:hypothetical protein
VIVFPPKSPTTTTTIYNSSDPEFTGSTGSSAPDDPTTTEGASPSGVLVPKVAVKTIPSALALAAGEERGPDGGSPSSAEVAGSSSGDSARLISAADAGDRAEQAAAPVASRRTGLTRDLPEAVRSPLGGILLAALVSFVVAGSYCGWLLLARR